MKKLLTLLLLVLGSQTQAQKIIFEKKIGTANVDWAYSAQQTSDGGYIMAGMGGGIGFGMEDFLLVKTDANGDTLWTKIFGTEGAGEFAQFVIETKDGGFAVVGYTESFGAGASDVYLVRTDANGDTLWTKTYGGNLNDQGNCIRETADGGFVIVGNTYIDETGYDSYIIRTDALGDTLWTRTIGGPEQDAATYFIITENEDLLICGYTYSYADYMDEHVFRMDKNGNLLWEARYDGPEEEAESGDYAYSLLDNKDGTFMVCGTKGYVAGTSLTGQAWLQKIDGAGAVLWSREFGEVFVDNMEGGGIVHCKGGGYLMLTNRYIQDTEMDIYLVKLNDNGDMIWTKTMPGFSETDKGLSLTLNSDSSFLIAGYTTDLENWYEIYLAKVDDGFSGVENRKSFSLNAYPNPFNDFATIELPSEISNDFQLKIINVEGKTITANTKKSGNKLLISKGNTLPGIYFFEIISKIGDRYTGKFIIE